jgi:hypothetical protein
LLTARSEYLFALGIIMKISLSPTPPLKILLLSAACAAVSIAPCAYAEQQAADSTQPTDHSLHAKLERAADKTGQAVTKGAEKTKHGLTVAAEHTEHALHTAATKTQSALKKTGDKIGEVVGGEKKTQ